MINLGRAMDTLQLVLDLYMDEVMIIAIAYHQMMEREIAFGFLVL